MDSWEFVLGDYNKQKMKKINLPHDWAITAPIDKDMDEGAAQGFRNRWNIGWYRKIYKLKEKKNNYKYYLDFGGIYENSTIWINGNEAGGRKYGYSSFALDITDYVNAGDNEILVCVDNTVKPADRWYSGAGIYRTVKWVEVEKNHFDKNNIVVKSHLQDAYEKAHITVDTGLNADVEAELICDEAKYTARSETGKLEFEITNPKLWTAESPNLYTMQLKLIDDKREADCISMRIGLRTVEMIPENGLFVNGKKVILKGVCLHQEAGSAGIAVKPELWKARLENLKEMGCNALRLAHHLYAQEFLDLCDEMGFYVYEEPFDKWKGGLYGRYFETEWEKDVEIMVKRDRNRPSIIIWGTGNEVENQGQESMLEILKMIRNKIYSMDQTRPITYAMNPHFKRESNIDIRKVKDIQKFVDVEDDREIYDMDERLERIQKIAELVDIISCNYQEQWYEEIHKKIPDKLILGTETYEFFKGDREQMQNFTCENPQLMPFEKNYVIGGMIWTGIDYLGESMGYPSKGWSGAPIRTNGERRPAYYVLQSYWSSKPMVHFSVMDYSLEDEYVKEHWDMPMYADHWHFPQFHKAVIPYMIATNCEKVRLFLNEKEIMMKTPQEYPNRMITGFLPWIPGVVRVEGLIEDEVSCVYTVKTPGAPIRLKFDAENISISRKKGYEVLVGVGAVDDAGTPYFRESTKVRFWVEGPARIVGVDNGNLMSGENYHESFIHMYHGRASVRVEMTGETGKITLFASAEGMYMAQTVLQEN